MAAWIAAGISGNRCSCSTSCACLEQKLQALLEQIAHVKRRALEEFHAATVPRICAIANRILRSRVDSEEIAGDVMLYIWTHAAEYRVDRGAVWAWLAVMTKHRAIDYLRHRRRHAQFLQLEGNSGLHITADVSHAIAQIHDERALTEALEKLPVRRRTLIRLSFFEGWSHSRMANTLEMPLGTVKSDVRRAIRSMHGAVCGPS